MFVVGFCLSCVYLAGGCLFSPDPGHSVACYGGLEPFRRGKDARTNTQHMIH